MMRIPEFLIPCVCDSDDFRLLNTKIAANHNDGIPTCAFLPKATFDHDATNDRCCSFGGQCLCLCTCLGGKFEHCTWDKDCGVRRNLPLPCWEYFRQFRFSRKKNCNSQLKPFVVVYTLFADLSTNWVGGIER
jgi:hypothetical protein